MDNNDFYKIELTTKGKIFRLRKKNKTEEINCLVEDILEALADKKVNNNWMNCCLSIIECYMESIDVIETEVFGSLNRANDEDRKEDSLS